MRIVITGAGGFVGRRLAALLENHQVIALDAVADNIPTLPHVTALAGDLRDESMLETAFAKGCDAVVHLATVPGGAAEINPSLARKVNIDSTMALADIAMRSGSVPRFVFASSIAVLGDSLPNKVDDQTQLLPSMLYGAHKLMMEQWLATLARRGDLDAVSLRLSGVIARPKGPSGMKSAFLSNVFHALKSGESFEMPVSEDASSWLISLEYAAKNFAHAIDADLRLATPTRAITLPALRVRIGDLVNEIVAQVGESTSAVRYLPDLKLEATFATHPPLHTENAHALGFMSDSNLRSMVRHTLGSLTV